MTTTVKDYVSQQGLSTLQRPRYSAGLLLEDEDLTAAVEYTRNMMRLLFRSLFGCGVICGLEIDALLTCNRTKVKVKIGKGVALDCLANPIHIPKGDEVTFDAECEPLPKCLWVTVCYIEKCCRPKDISCSPDDDMHVVHTRSHDGYEIRLHPKRPKCACWCKVEGECEDEAEKKPDDCCDEQETTETQIVATVKAMTAQAAATAAPAAGSALPRQVKVTGGRKQYPYGEASGDEEPTLDPICECFKDHYAGKCDCECGCDCVVIGTIHLTEIPKAEVGKSTDVPLKVNRDVVRWIRPMLVGYRKCFDPKPAKTSEPVMQETSTAASHAAQTARP